MKYFIDTEFIEDGKTIDLISIGIVREDGENYYAQNIQCDLSRASKWVRENVVSCLDDIEAFNGFHERTNPFWSLASLAHHTVWRTREDIAKEILKFIGDDDKPKFWAYYADYDWVVLCQLFGTMMDLPKNWPMFCRDLKQLANSLQLPRLDNKQFFTDNIQEHNALADAEWELGIYKTIQRLTADVEIPAELLLEA